MCSLTSIAEAWYDSDWTYRFKLTVDNTKVSGTQTDFPVYVDLGDVASAHGFWEGVQADGDDIRVTDSSGDDLVPVELVAINTGSETGELHFKATVSGGADTDFYIYYGNGTVAGLASSATYGSENVWSNNYGAVWHLEESSAENVKDSTSNDVDEGTPSSSATDIAGKMGRAFDFNNSTNSIFFDTNVSAISPTAQVSMSMWFESDTQASDVLWYCRGDSTSKGHGIWFWDSNLRPSIGSGGSGLIWTNVTYAMSNINNGTWYHYTAAWDGSTAKHYVDGVERDSYSKTGAIQYSGTQCMIGSRASGDDYDGTIDEVRISTVGRSGGWVLTEYNNQSSPSTFYTIGAEEEDAAGGGRRVILVK